MIAKKFGIGTLFLAIFHYPPNEYWLRRGFINLLML